MQKPSMTDKVKNVLGVGHGHTHGTGVTGHHGAGTHNGGVVQQVENAVTGHGTHGTHTHGTGPGTGLGAGTHNTGTAGLGHTGHPGVLGQVENAVTGHGTHGTHAHGTHAHGTGTHASGPAGLLAKAKLKVTGHT